MKFVTLVLKLPERSARLSLSGYLDWFFLNQSRPLRFLAAIGLSAEMGYVVIGNADQICLKGNRLSIKSKNPREAQATLCDKALASRFKNHRLCGGIRLLRLINL